MRNVLPIVFIKNIKNAEVRHFVYTTTVTCWLTFCNFSTSLAKFGFNGLQNDGQVEFDCFQCKIKHVQPILPFFNVLYVGLLYWLTIWM